MFSSGSAVIPTVTGTPFLTEPGLHPGRRGVWKLGTTLGQYVTVAKSSPFLSQYSCRELSFHEKNTSKPTVSNIQETSRKEDFWKMDTCMTQNTFSSNGRKNVCDPYVIQNIKSQEDYVNCHVKESISQDCGVTNHGSCECRQFQSEDGTFHFVTEQKTQQKYDPCAEPISNLSLSNHVECCLKDEQESSCCKKKKWKYSLKKSTWNGGVEKIVSYGLSDDKELNTESIEGHLNTTAFLYNLSQEKKSFSEKFDEEEDKLEDTLCVTPLSNSTLDTPRHERHCERSSFGLYDTIDIKKNSYEGYLSESQVGLNESQQGYRSKKDISSIDKKCSTEVESLGSTNVDKATFISSPLLGLDMTGNQSLNDSDVFWIDHDQKSNELHLDKSDKNLKHFLSIPKGVCGICWEKDATSKEQVTEQVREFDNEMIACRACGVLIHPQCYGLFYTREEKDVRNAWFCAACEYSKYRKDDLCLVSKSIDESEQNKRLSVVDKKSPTDPCYRTSCAEEQIRRVELLDMTQETGAEMHQPHVVIICSLCQRSGGVFCIGEEHLWVHVSCVLYSTEGPQFSLPFFKKQPIWIRRYLALQYQKQYSCYLCQESTGFTVPCNALNCFLRMHISCAFLQRFLPHQNCVFSTCAHAQRRVKFLFCIHHSQCVEKIKTMYVTNTPTSYETHDACHSFSAPSKENQASEHSFPMLKSSCLPINPCSFHPSPWNVVPLYKNVPTHMKKGIPSVHNRTFQNSSRNKTFPSLPTAASRRRWNMLSNESSLANCADWYNPGMPPSSANYRLESHGARSIDIKKRFQSSLCVDLTQAQTSRRRTCHAKRRSTKTNFFPHRFSPSKWYDRSSDNGTDTEDFIGSPLKSSRALKMSRHSKSRLQPFMESCTPYDVSQAQRSKQLQCRRVEKKRHKGDEESDRRESMHRSRTHYTHSRDGRGRPRRGTRHINGSDFEKKGQAAHFGMGAHIILRGIRLKWSRYDSLFQKTSFLTNVLKQSIIQSVAYEDALRQCLCKPHDSLEDSLHCLALFLVSKQTPFSIEKFCEPLPFLSPFGMEDLNTHTNKGATCQAPTTFVFFSHAKRRQVTSTKIPRHTFQEDEQRDTTQSTMYPASSEKSQVLRLNYKSPKCCEQNVQVDSFPMNHKKEKILQEPQGTVMGSFGVGLWKKHVAHEAILQSEHEKMLFEQVDILEKSLQQDIKNTQLAWTLPVVKDIWKEDIKEFPRFLYFCFIGFLLHCSCSQQSYLQTNQRLFDFFLKPIPKDLSKTFLDSLKMLQEVFKKWTVNELCQSLACVRKCYSYHQDNFLFLQPYFATLFFQKIMNGSTLKAIQSHLGCLELFENNLLTYLTPHNSLSTGVPMLADLEVPLEKNTNTLMGHWRDLVQAQKNRAGSSVSDVTAATSLPQAATTSQIFTPIQDPDPLTEKKTSLYTLLPDIILSQTMCTQRKFDKSEENSLNARRVSLQQETDNFKVHVATCPLSTPQATGHTLFNKSEYETPVHTTDSDTPHTATSLFTEMPAERTRYRILRDMLWDVNVSSQLFDFNVLKKLDWLKKKQTQTDDLEESLSGIGVTPRHSEYSFVKQQIGYYLSLLNKVTTKLDLTKNMYCKAITLDEQMPLKLHHQPQAEALIHLFCSITSKWGRIASQCVRGLSDRTSVACMRSQNCFKEFITPCLIQDTKNMSSATSFLTVPDASQAIVKVQTSATSLNKLHTSTSGNRIKYCCICFEEEWEPDNPVLTCVRCFTSLHKKCYIVPESTADDENEAFFCKRCTLEKKRHDMFISGSIRCDFCNTLGGALKHTKEGGWVHVLCALFLLPAVVPEDLQTFDHWDVSMIPMSSQAVNCSVCCMSNWKPHMKRCLPIKEAMGDETDVFTASYSEYHLESFPLRTSDAPPHYPMSLYRAHRRGVCVSCSYEKCERSFHPFCAWLAGMYVKVTLKNNSFYPWNKKIAEMCSKQDETLRLRNEAFFLTMDQIYFPMLQFEIFCFDHSPSCTTIFHKEELVTRSSSYQRCLRQQEFMNRDLYPNGTYTVASQHHLINGGCKTSRQPCQELLIQDTLSVPHATTIPTNLHAFDASGANDMKEKNMHINAGYRDTILDTYYDHICCICFTHAHSDAKSADQRLRHCRRCGLAVHPVCYNDEGLRLRVFSPTLLSKKSTALNTKESYDILLNYLVSVETQFEKPKELFPLTDLLCKIEAYNILQLDLPQVFFPSLKNLDVTTLQDIYFTCDVCSNGYVPEHVVCVVCGRKGGALRILHVEDSERKNSSSRDTVAEMFIHVVCATYAPGISIEDSNGLFSVKTLDTIIKSDFYGSNKCQLCDSKDGITLPCSYPSCSVFNHARCLQHHNCWLGLHSAVERFLDEEKPIKPLPVKLHPQNLSQIHTFCYTHTKLKLKYTRQPLHSSLQRMKELLEQLRVKTCGVKNRVLSKENEIATFLKLLQLKKPLLTVKEARSNNVASLISSEKLIPFLSMDTKYDAAYINKGYTVTSSTKWNTTLDYEPVRLFPEKPILNSRTVPYVLEEVTTKVLEASVGSETLLEALPPFTKLSLDKLYVLGQARALTIAEIVDFSRMLLPDYQRRRRGRPSAKEKVIRVLTTGALQYLKAQKHAHETLQDVVKRLPLESMKPCDFTFWVEASTIADQYGKSLQAILCGTTNGANEWMALSSSKKTLFTTYQRQHNQNGMLVPDNKSMITTSVEETTKSSPLHMDEQQFWESPQNNDPSTPQVSEVDVSLQTQVKNVSMALKERLLNEKNIQDQQHFVDFACESKSHGTDSSFCKECLTIQHGGDRNQDAHVFSALGETTTHESQSCLNTNLNVQVCVTEQIEKQHVIQASVEEALSSSGGHVVTSSSSLLDSRVEDFSTVVDTFEKASKSSPNGYVKESPPLFNSHVEDTGGLPDNLLEASLSVEYSLEQKTVLFSENHLETNTLPLLNSQCGTASLHSLKGKGKAVASALAEDHAEGTRPLVPETHVEGTNPPGPETHVEPTKPRVPEAQVEPTNPRVPEAQVEPTKPRVPEAQAEPTTPPVTETHVKEVLSSPEGSIHDASPPVQNCIVKKGVLVEKIVSESPVVNLEKKKAGNILNKKPELTMVDANTVLHRNVSDKISTDPCESSCIATRLRRSVRKRHTLGMSEEKKEEEGVLDNAGQNESRISTRGHKVEKATKVEFLDVYQIVANTVLSSFETVKELENFCWFHISFSVSQNGKSTDLHVGDNEDFFFLSKKYVDDKVHPTSFTESLQLCDLFSAVALHEVRTVVVRPIKPSPTNICNSILCMFQSLRSAKNDSHIPLLSFLFLQPENIKLFQKLCQDAVKGNIQSLEEVHTTYISCLTNPSMKLLVLKREDVWLHFSWYGKYVRDKSFNQVMIEKWLPPVGNNLRQPRRYPTLTQAAVDDVTRYFQHLIGWVLQQVDNPSAALCNIPGWNTHNSLWNDTNVFSLFYLTQSVRIFCTTLWKWREGLVVGYGSPLLANSQRFKFHQKDNQKYPELYGERKQGALLCSHEEDTELEKPQYFTNYSYLVYFEISETFVFEWCSLTLWDFVETKNLTTTTTTTTTNVSKLFELDSKYHIRSFLTWTTLSNCYECQKPLMSYWKDKTPSEFLLCQNLSRGSKNGKDKVLTLIKCHNTTCRECVEKTLANCKTLSSWDTCATWKCSQCRRPADSTETTKTENVTVHESERSLSTGSGKDTFSATFKSLQTCKNFSCRTDSMLDYKLKKQCGKVSWRIGLTSKEKKRQKSDMKDFYQASHELKKFRKQK
ncbi:uncharacterized protein LOC128882899 isoform X2 [Hylaeus volcanicus]|uniref:uncharacterized protein LOC128882899 isoform X2 n=1 Tax=Hylaeus volcanicus TaxID=313075 RepID=UPI0023B85739|nr:uncharacterized protein LOC128882899 isoform X2 [Hylaeus volcanicus]